MNIQDKKKYFPLKRLINIQQVNGSFSGVKRDIYITQTQHNSRILINVCITFFSVFRISNDIYFEHAIFCILFYSIPLFLLEPFVVIDKDFIHLFSSTFLLIFGRGITSASARTHINLKFL